MCGCFSKLRLKTYYYNFTFCMQVYLCRNNIIAWRHITRPWHLYIPIDVNSTCTLTKPTNRYCFTEAITFDNRLNYHENVCQCRFYFWWNICSNKLIFFLANLVVITNKSVIILRIKLHFCGIKYNSKTTHV